MKKLELLYINKKQNKTTITKKKTKCKEKEKKKKKRREEKKNGFCPESNAGPSARHAILLPLCHVKRIVKKLIIFY